VNVHAPRADQRSPLPETLFSVPGMRCAACIARIEDGLAHAPGVVRARVNFTAKRVAITHLPGATLQQLVKAIAATGFDAQPLVDALALADSDSRMLLRAVAVAGFAATNVMLLSVSVWAGAEGATRDLFHWLSAMIALPAIAYAGRPFFKSAWTALRAGHTNMDVPISIGVILASAISLFETITHGPHAYFDSAIMLLFFLLTGRVLDSIMRDRARDGVTALLRHTAPGALVAGTDGSGWVAAADLRAGMMMIVAAGERLAADGVIATGHSAFDCALLTGESVPIRAAPGSRVHAGTLNLDAPVTVTVTAAGADTAIADIARLMEQAAQSKSHYVRIADRAARLYAPAVHSLAALSFIGWMIAGAGWHTSLLIAVSVLIITCPCALGLAVPAAQIVAAGVLMRAGVLVKDGSALERLAEADLAVFDKTGTLTLGRPAPQSLDALDAQQRGVALALARASRHPLSQGLRTSLEAEGVVAADVTDITEIAGQGMAGRFEGRTVSLSRPAADDGPTMAAMLTMAGAPPATIRFDDSLRPEAAATIDALAALGLPARILSGDRDAVVAPIARKLGLPERADMTPQAKLAAIEEFASGGATVLMVGDGLNDGPALAAGHVSMAPASASDASQNAADAVFLGDSLAPVATAIRVARATQRIVRQNFALAVGYNVVAVPLAIAGVVTPLLAALAMSGSSLIVVGNALRLRLLVK
jgi:P-type Cu2+ transporter